MTTGTGVTAAEAREHLRAYAARIDDLEGGVAPHAAERAVLEDALRHATRALAFAVRRTEAGDPPTAAFDALAELAREAGVESDPAIARPPDPSLPDPGTFERWLLAGVPALIGASLPRGGAVIGDALERAYDDYEDAPDGERVERLGGIVPLLESLYELYVRASLGRAPAEASSDELARATLSLALVATARADARR